MSDIMVKQLAETVGAPVEILLKQLQAAGIKANNAEDMITTAEKLLLLEHIQAGQKKASLSKSGGKKLGLKRREKSVVSVSGSRGEVTGRKVNVAVRRKKVALKKAVPAVATVAETAAAAEAIAEHAVTASRTEMLAKQLDAERKAREQANMPLETTSTAEEPEVLVETEIVEEEVVIAVVDDVEQETPVDQAEVEKASIEPSVVEESVEEKAEVVVETAKVEDVAKEEPKVEKAEIIEEKVKEEPKAEESKAEVDVDSKTTTESKDAKPNILNLSGKERRDLVAARAKAEAQSMFKRRPSRKPKPVVVAAKVETKAAKPAVKAKPATAATTKTADKKPKQFRNADSKGALHLSKDNKRGGKRKGKKGRRQRTPDVQIDTTKHQFERPTAPVVHEIQIPETIVVGDLAKELKVQGVDVIRAMMGMGVMATINHTLDQDTAILIVEEMGHVATPLADESDESLVAQVFEEDDDHEQFPRPPVVTIMGHVDHGKTSLLDYIRESRVTAGEAGGITQHIGAYHVETDNGVISFLDTPGHAAFSAMRARGANATDIVIIVVAADDGVMPQTKEAIEHTRAAGVPLIVAINKIDKETAEPDRVKNELTQHEVVPEDWGGDDVFVNVSAHTGEGIDELLESISLVSEVLELKAPIDGPAKGSVVEASIEKGRGAVATVMVQKGTLKKGDFALSGKEYGRIRALFDENGKPVQSAGPSIPVSVLGLSGAPVAGESLLVVKDERKAKEIAEARRQQEKDSLFATQQAAKLDAMFSKMKDGEKLTVPVLLKADVQGSVEALRDSLNKLSTDEVAVNIISAGVGGFSETDVNLALTAGAVMIGFNVRADASAKRMASESGAEIRYYSIIYEIIDDIRDAMSGLLAPELREEFVGLAEVKEVFRSSGFGSAAGCLVIDGAVRQGLPIRVLRDNVVVFEGELESLRRHKDLVNEVLSGTECGIAVKDYKDIQVGDQIECFNRIEVERKL